MIKQARFKRCHWQPGMVYAVPLEDGSFGVAQALLNPMPTVVDVALFKTRLHSFPVEIPPIKPLDLISISATWRKALDSGEWGALGLTSLIIDPMETPNQQKTVHGLTGVTHSDAALIAKFLSAWHGLIPWNVMFDENYYDKMLLPDLKRPPSALVLSQEDREIYRAQRTTTNTRA